MDEYQLFKSLLTVLTPFETFNELSERLKGKLSPEDIAFTIYEVTKICGFCKDKRKIGRRKCPVCCGKAENYLKFYINRLDRYRIILSAVPEVWKERVCPADKSAHQK